MSRRHSKALVLPRPDSDRYRAALEDGRRLMKRRLVSFGDRDNYETEDEPAEPSQGAASGRRTRVEVLWI